MGSAGDFVVVGDEGILQAQVLAELAGTMEVHGHAGIHQEQVAHGRAFPVVGAVGGGVGQLPQGADGDLVACILICDGLADLPVADAAVDGGGAQTGDEVIIDLFGGIRGEHDVRGTEGRSIGGNQLVAAEAQGFRQVMGELLRVARAGLVEPVELDFVAVLAGVDHGFHRGGGRNRGDVDSVAVEETGVDFADEDLVAVEVLGSRFGQGGKRIQEIPADGLHIHGLRGDGRLAGGHVEGVRRVADIERILAEAVDHAADFIRGGGGGDARLGGTQELAVIDIAVDLDGIVFHIDKTVLVELVADEVELPSGSVGIGDFPGIRAGSAENFNQLIQHYPSLTFAFR